MIDTIALVAGIVTILMAIPYIRNFLLSQYRRRIKRSFWDGQGSDYILIHRTYVVQDPKYGEEQYIKHQTVSAIRLLDEFISKIGGSVRLKNSDEPLNNSERKANIVILGSSRRNRIVEKDFPEAEKYFSFGHNSATNEFYLKNNYTGFITVSPLSIDDSGDLALIVKIPNRFEPKNRVYYLAGIHAFGTWAAAEYVTKTQYLRKIPRTTRQEGVAGVIWARYSGFYEISELREDSPFSKIS
jgi:hypothetical protein